MDKLYKDIESYQKNEDEWGLSEMIIFLHLWKKRLNFEFKLELNNIVLNISPVSSRINGQYTYKHNGFGFLGTVTINQKIINHPLCQILGVLLHELLHGWQELYGKPGKRNYHNREYVKKAEKLGLLVDEKGYMTYSSTSVFLDLLKLHGIDIDNISDVEEPKKGTSKMKKWSCGCTNVRSAIVLEARCLKCGGTFKIQE